jgi:hypothetical protein
MLAVCFLLFRMQIFAQSDCFNKVEIKQLGVEFCLPDLEWEIEEDDGLKFIRIHKSGLYWGTNVYTLRTEKISEDLSSLQYFEEDNLISTPDYTQKIIKHGTKKINGKEFYFAKTHAVYKSKERIINSYAITYYFCKDKIGYALSYVVDDENKMMWKEEEALKVWESFRIVSQPENGVLD